MNKTTQKICNFPACRRGSSAPWWSDGKGWKSHNQDPLRPLRRSLCLFVSLSTYLYLISSGGRACEGDLQYYPFRVMPYMMKVQDAVHAEDQFCCLLFAERIHSGYDGKNKTNKQIYQQCSVTKKWGKKKSFSISPQNSNWQAYLHYHTLSKLCVSGRGWEVIYCVFSINYHTKRWLELTVYFFFSC